MTIKTGLMSLTAGVALILGGCGADDKSSTIQLAMSDVSKGVAELSIHVSGSTTAGDPVSVSPLMEMNSGMRHGTPLSSYSGELDENGEFKTTAYFLMPSNMPDGTSMGNWSITVDVAGQKKTFPITVDMMGSDRKNLRGAESGEDSDIIAGMMADEGRPYYLFERARTVNDQENSLEVYVAARETMMEYASISNSQQPILNEGTAYELAVTSVIVEMCSSQCESSENWLAASEDPHQPGVYKREQLSLAGDNNDEIKVRLKINDAVKTNGEFDYATFSYSNTSMSGAM